MPEKITAAALIKQQASRVSQMPSPEAVKELQELFKYNDTRLHAQQHVSREAAIAMLAGYGFKCGRATLDRVCRELGRKSYTTP